MTRDEIIGMAREADPFGDDGRLATLAARTPEILERFANDVAAMERTACFRHYEVAMRNAVTAERAACAQIAREEIIDFLRMTINDGRLARDFEAGNRVAARIESLILRRGES